MIKYNSIYNTSSEIEHIAKAIEGNHLSGDGPYSLKCSKWFEQTLNTEKALLVPSCTAALEMAAILIDIKPGDEVIMPSYTFVSTANAFILRGAKIVFVDIRSDTMNIDETQIEAAITPKTRAIVPVHYAGVACEMDVIMRIANEYGLLVIEDAAQGMMATYKGKPLGSIGHLGTYSFHETKNYTSGGEGGLLIINDACFVERAEIIREKGTNRKAFVDGKVDKYSWVDVGSSFLMSEIQAAYLWGQIEKCTLINERRLDIWNTYYSSFKSLEMEKLIELPQVPKDCRHNAHIFYMKVESLNDRQNLLRYLGDNGVQATSHYVPLHNTKFSKSLYCYKGSLIVTEDSSSRLLRLPIYPLLEGADVQKICKLVNDFFKL